MATMRAGQRRSWLTWLTTRTRRFMGWLEKPEKHLHWWRLMIILAVCATLAIGPFIWAAYAYNWQWTGFSDNRYFDWMRLLLIPLALSAGTIWYTRGDAETPLSELMDQAERRTLMALARVFWSGKAGIEPFLLLLAGLLAAVDALMVVLGVVVFLPLSFFGPHWTWTGYQGKALWDWLEMLLLPLSVMFATIWLNSYHTRHRVRAS